MLKLPSLDLVFSSNRGELETLGTTYPSENLSVGGCTSLSGSKNSVSKSGAPGNMHMNVCTTYSLQHKHNVLWSKVRAEDELLHNLRLDISVLVVSAGFLHVVAASRKCLHRYSILEFSYLSECSYKRQALTRRIFKLHCCYKGII